MPVSVICLSRTMAAGAEDIGHRVAERLGFRYVDEQIIAKAARQAQVDPALVAAAEHRQPLLQRILQKIPKARELVGPLSLATGLPVDAAVNAPANRADAEDLRLLIRATIHEVARSGRVVVVAHAASMALANMPGVLRVLITASADIRAARLAQSEHLDAAAAAAAIAASDRERIEYFRQFYKLDAELPTHYDLVLNTDTLTSAQVIEIILAAAE